MPSRNLRARLLPRLARIVSAVPHRVLMASRPVLAAVLQRSGGWGGRVRGAMAAALGPDGFEERHVRDYFRHAADLIAYSAIIYHRGLASARLEQEWVEEPASRRRYRDALAEGKGAVMV